MSVLWGKEEKKTPLKQNSLKCNSQESWCTLANKHSMTNPSRQMTRPRHLTHNEWSPSKWLQSKATTQTWVMELHFCQEHTGLTKRAISAPQHSLKSLMGPAKLLRLAFVCESDHMSATQRLLSVFVGISISSDFSPACTVCLCVCVCVCPWVCTDVWVCVLAHWCICGCFAVCACVWESTSVFLKVLLQGAVQFVHKNEVSSERHLVKREKSQKKEKKNLDQNRACK